MCQDLASTVPGKCARQWGLLITPANGLSFRTCPGETVSRQQQKWWAGMEGGSLGGGIESDNPPT